MPVRFLIPAWSAMGSFEGQEVLGLSMNFSKRWITLSAYCDCDWSWPLNCMTLIDLFGDASKTEYGITCALLTCQS